MKCAVLIFVLLAVSAVTRGWVYSEEGFGVKWSYNATVFPPAQWSTNYPSCGLARQSPINIEPMKVVSGYNLLSALSFDYTSINTAVSKVWNGGPSVDVEFPTPANLKFTDGYGSLYYLNAVHFHWNDNSLKGSEHSIASRFEAVEIHFVHFSSAFSSLSAAVNSGVDGAVSVIALLMKVGSANAALEKVLGIPNKAPVTAANASSVTGFDPRSLLAATSDNLDYLHYNGSLTTPGCQQIVRWYVLQTRGTLSGDQLIALRKFTHSTSVKMTSNSRPVQPLNSRVIYAYPSMHAVTAVASKSSIASASVALALGLTGTLITIIVFIAILVHSRFYRPPSNQ